MSLSNDAVVFVLKALRGITSNPDQCFTAFDITKATRSLTDDRIDHEDVREVIHTFFDQGFLNRYDRQDHSFLHNQQWITAKLFVPYGANPADYNPDKVKMDKNVINSVGVLLQDSAGKALITCQNLSDEITDDLEEDNPEDIKAEELQKSENPVLDDPHWVSPSPSQKVFGSSSPKKPVDAYKPLDNKMPRSKSLFDQIKSHLTQLPKKFFSND